MYLGISSKCLGHIEFNLYDRSKMTLRLKTSPIRDDQDKSAFLPTHHTAQQQQQQHEQSTSEIVHLYIRKANREIIKGKFYNHAIVSPN